MEFQIIWFILWGVLWGVYFMTDGFDFGAGILHNFLARNEEEKATVIKAIGPVWDGNQVWLITAGGATFAAFPTTYAMMFSWLYTPLLLILFALILRGVAVEFRGKEEGRSWKKLWDVSLFLGSLIPALLFGTAFGNIFMGLPIDGSGYHGTLFTLLNPYGLLTGVLFVLLMTVHGALFLKVKTDGGMSDRAGVLAGRLWYPLLAVAAAFLAATFFATKLYDNFFSVKPLFLLPLLAVLSLAGIKLFIARGDFLKAFFASCLTILTVVFTGVTGLYPNLIPSSMAPEFSLTIFNSSSSRYTLIIMTVVAGLIVPVVIAYQIWVYRLFSRKVGAHDPAGDIELY